MNILVTKKREKKITTKDHGAIMCKMEIIIIIIIIIICKRKWLGGDQCIFPT